jgi:hypothetical protein
MLVSDERPRHPCAHVELEARPFEPVMQRVLEEWPEVKAPRLAEILREHGYRCSVDLLERRLRELRPPAERPANVAASAPRRACSWTGGTAHASQDRWPRAAGLRAGQLTALLGRAVGALLVPANARVVSEGHVRLCDWRRGSCASGLRHSALGGGQARARPRALEPALPTPAQPLGRPHYRLHARTRARRPRSTARCAISRGASGRRGGWPRSPISTRAVSRLRAPVCIRRLHA